MTIPIDNSPWAITDVETLWPYKTSSSFYINYYKELNTTRIRSSREEKVETEEKEKKEMANTKMCDVCGAVYSTKKYVKIFNEMDENYDIHLRFFDSCSNDVDICPDCYKALIDKLVERGLEPVEKDDEKDDN